MIDFYPVMGKDCDPGDALLSPRLVMDPKGEFLNKNRRWQGVPAIERSPSGKIWFACYSGLTDEGIGNWVVVFRNGDEGKTQNEPLFAVCPSNSETCRTFDPCLWFAPDGALWLFVAQSYTYYDGRDGVWAMVCRNSDDENPTFSQPRRIANGIMMNKPIVRGNEWLLPCAIWDKFKTEYNHIPEETFSNVYVTEDGGKNFRYLSSVDYPDRFVDEHMIAELSDGSLLMLIRGKHGIGKAVSCDGGRTWSRAVDSEIGGPCSRFCLKKLNDGRLLLINHYRFTKRNNLTAMISDDDGKTWKGFLLLDGRDDVSYPDAVQAEDGTIYVIYDRERYDARELLMAKFRPEDVEAGRLVSPDAKLGVILTKAGGEKPTYRNGLGKPAENAEKK